MLLALILFYTHPDRILHRKLTDRASTYQRLNFYTSDNELVPSAAAAGLGCNRADYSCIWFCFPQWQHVAGHNKRF